MLSASCLGNIQIMNNVHSFSFDVPTKHFSLMSSRLMTSRCCVHVQYVRHAFG